MIYVYFSTYTIKCYFLLAVISQSLPINYFKVPVRTIAIQCSYKLEFTPYESSNVNKFTLASDWFTLRLLRETSNILWWHCISMSNPFTSWCGNWVTDVLFKHTRLNSSCYLGMALNNDYDWSVTKVEGRSEIFLHFVIVFF